MFNESYYSILLINLVLHVKNHAANVFARHYDHIRMCNKLAIWSVLQKKRCTEQKLNNFYDVKSISVSWILVLLHNLQPINFEIKHAFKC